MDKCIGPGQLKCEVRSRGGKSSCLTRHYSLLFWLNGSPHIGRASSTSTDASAAATSRAVHASSQSTAHTPIILARTPCSNLTLSHICPCYCIRGKLCHYCAEGSRNMRCSRGRGSFAYGVLTIPSAHFVLCNVFCTGYFPGNGHEFCWPCAKTATANKFYLIGGSILIFSLWGLLSLGITSRSVGILMNFLQVTNLIQVLL